MGSQDGSATKVDERVSLIKTVVSHPSQSSHRFVLGKSVLRHISDAYFILSLLNPKEYSLHNLFLTCQREALKKQDEVFCAPTV